MFSYHRRKERHVTKGARFTQPYLVSVATGRGSALDAEELALAPGHAVPLFRGGGLGPVGREGVVVAVGDGAAIWDLLDVIIENLYRILYGFFLLNTACGIWMGSFVELNTFVKAD